MKKLHKFVKHWQKRKKSKDKLHLKRKSQSKMCFIKIKKKCWQDFLEDKKKILDPAKIQPKDKNRC